jgi:type IV pilus assembly protein PilC
MLTYTYKAKNGQGIAVVGEMLADHRDAAVNALRKRGYFLISVEAEGRLGRWLRSSMAFGGRVRMRDRAIFTRQLATLLKAGCLLSMALKTLSRQTENKTFASVIQQVHSDIEDSRSLSQAMARHPKVFSPVYCSIVAAAEEAGTLPETLSLLSDQLKAQASLNARIKGAMIYPLFLLVVSAIVVGVLTGFVIPKFIELFVNSNQRLPLPTQILVGLTSAVRQKVYHRSSRSLARRTVRQYHPTIKGTKATAAKAPYTQAMDRIPLRCPDPTVGEPGEDSPADDSLTE